MSLNCKGSFGPNYLDTSFGANHVYEMGPLTLGYERWANLSPDTYKLQSFGHASVLEDGTLEIKLMNIDGNVLFEKTLAPETDIATPGPSSSASIFDFANHFVAALIAVFSLSF